MIRPAVVAARRTPFTSLHGALSAVHPVDLFAHLLRALDAQPALVERVDAVIVGCASPVGAQGDNVGRAAVLAAGWRDDLSATTVVQHGTSSLRAIELGAALVAAGSADVVVAGGVEVMSLVPMGASAMGRHGYGKPWGERVASRYAATGGLVPEARRIEAMAADLGITRDAQDRWATHAIARAAGAARERATELVPVEGVTDDEVRSLEHAVESYPSMFDDEGTLTAANVAPIGDGAALVVLAAPAIARGLGLEPLAEVLATSSVGRGPCTQRTAMPEAFRRLGCAPDELAIVEIHEGFAAAVLATAAELGLPLDALNRRGGALGLGHPLGASGARAAVSALAQLGTLGAGRAAVLVEGEDAAAGVVFGR